MNSTLITLHDLKVQVITESQYRSTLPKPKNYVRDYDIEWPRLKAAAKQLENEHPEIKELTLIEVQQKQYLGGLLKRHYTFEKRK